MNQMMMPMVRRPPPSPWGHGARGRTAAARSGCTPSPSQPPAPHALTVVVSRPVADNPTQRTRPNASDPTTRPNDPT